MAAAAGGEAGFCLRVSCASCDDDCASFARPSLDGLSDMERWRKAREKEKGVKVRSLTALEKRRKAKARRDAQLKKLRERRGDGLADEAAAVAEHDGAWADLEPLFFDEAAAVAEHERRIQREEDKMAEHERRIQREQENKKLRKARAAALDRIREFDPKTGTTYYSRLEYVDDIATFDHLEESPLGPMRYTEALIYAHASSDSNKKFIPIGSGNMLARRSSGDEKKLIASYSANLGPIEKITFSLEGDNSRFLPQDSVNVFSIKIVSSDVGFPIDVYGTVIARDKIDLKAVYLFRRDRDHSQLILTKDESLILTGPKRGLALGTYVYFEFDLKIKCAGKRKEQLSKGYMALDAIKYSLFEEMEVESKTLDTKLSKVMITYAVVHTAVEATFAIEVLQGRFYGEITACTTGIRDSVLLHDSKMVEAKTNSGKGAIRLLRNVVAVDMREKLILSIVARSDGKTKSTTVGLTPGLIGGKEKEITCGSIKMCVKVRWSIISRRFR